MRNATIYPSEKLSELMHELINSVESFESILVEPLKKLGYEPTEPLPFDIVYLGQERSYGQTKTLTASEVVQHFTTTEKQGFHLMGQSHRASRLIELINHKKYKKKSDENFLTVEALNPIKKKFKKNIIDAIRERFKAFGIDRDDRATLRAVKYRGRIGANIGAAQHGTEAELGMILEIEKDGETQRFAVVPHHPDLVIRIPSAGDAWKRWMKGIGKSLFFRDPSAIPSHAHFFTDHERGEGYYPIRAVGSAISHTVKPIVDKTVEYMSQLVSNETPFEEALHTILGLYIPYYDFGKAVLQKDFKSAVLFLSFEFVPHVGGGMKQIVQGAFRGTRAQNMIQRTLNSNLIPETFDRVKDMHGMGIAKKVMKPAGRIVIDRGDELASDD